MSIKILDNSGQVNGLHITTSGEAKVSITKTIDDAGYVTLAAESDDGSVTGTRLIMQPDISEDYRLRVGSDSLLFNEWFPASALNSASWTAPVTTMTAAVANGYLTLNANNTTAANGVARLSSYRTFPIYGTFGVSYESIILFTQLPQTNNVCEWGAGIATGTSAPSDGCFFRITSTGEFRAVLNTSGSEIQSDPLDFSALVGANVSKHFVVVVGEDKVQYWIGDILVASLMRQTTAGAISGPGSLPILFRNYNSSGVPVAQQMKIGMANVTLNDADDGKLWHHVLAGMGANGSQGQTGGTMGSTALYTNSLPANLGAAATNTTAALGSGLGGQFCLQPTLTSGTDGIVSSYQVPAYSAANNGKSLYITGVKINGVVTSACTGGPVIGVWSLAYGHTSVSLATTESATAKAPRRIPLGVQVFAQNAAVGVIDSREVWVPFEVPVLVQPGEFVQTVFKNVGTVTTAGVIMFTITFDSYWE